MANLKLFNPDGVNVTRLAELFLVVPIGATGAPGTYVYNWGFGAVPLTRTSAGVYTVTLGDAWAGGIVWYSANTKQATVAAGDGLSGVITADTISTLGTFTLTMLNNSAAAAEIRNGATLYLSIGLKNNVNVP